MLTMILLAWTVGIPAVVVLLATGAGIRRNRLAGRPNRSEPRLIELPSLFGPRGLAGGVLPVAGGDEPQSAAAAGLGWGPLQGA